MWYRDVFYLLYNEPDRSLKSCTKFQTYSFKCQGLELFANINTCTFYKSFRAAATNCRLEFLSGKAYSNRWRPFDKADCERHKQEVRHTLAVVSTSVMTPQERVEVSTVYLCALHAASCHDVGVVVVLVVVVGGGSIRIEDLETAFPLLLAPFVFACFSS